MKLTLYRPGDEQAMLALMTATRDRGHSLAAWRWRYADAPDGKAIIALAWDGDTLAGQYAVVPMAVACGKDRHTAALSLDTLTHPDYRGRGLFPQLAELVYDEAAARGLSIAYGWPNVNSHRALTTRCGWRDVGYTPTLRLHGLARSDSAPMPGSFDDPRLDELWLRRSEMSRVAAVRDGEHLRWRYSKPGAQYRIFAVDNADRALTAYAVTQRYREEIQIVDLLALDADAGEAAVDMVVRYAGAQLAPSVALWLPTGELHRRLERRGFRLDAPVLYFGRRALTPDGAELDALDWWLTMGDNDVF